jgi:lipopolysaccharide/colanic/teichoic acid biosynthesis glycosyltransferase
MRNHSGKHFKRVFDIVASSFGLIFLFPLMGLVAVVIRVTSPGPVFYGSSRIGLGGKLFKMVKFRTMVVGADKAGPLVTASNDPRITPIGRYLRRTKLDELPTLWNVFKGDMSIVGPRPENPKSAALYTEAQKSLWSVRPGITSMATLKYRHEESILASRADLETTYFQIMQDKLALELAYMKRQSFWFDIQIIFRTLVAVFR